jgi:molybdenum cofactor sulfurtransferase
MCAEEARSSVLSFFDAPPTEYTVIFTPNATGALRLVGEAFPFVQNSTFVLGTDSHNSINGIRQFALTKGAQLAYIASTSLGGMNEPEAKVPAFSAPSGSDTHHVSAECPDRP